MQLIPFEKELTALGVEAARPHALLAAPLVAVAHTRSRLTDDERSRISSFVADHLALDTSQRRTVETWLDAPPPRQFIEDALRLLVLLRQRADGVGFENGVYRHVLAEAGELVRERADAQDRERGEIVLHWMMRSLQIDLGVPWEDVAPEVLDSEAETKRKQDEAREKRPAIRRNLVSRRLDRSDHEGGGLI